MTHAFMPHQALVPYVSAYLVVSHVFEVEYQHIFSARGVPMLIFPFKTPSRSSYRYGLGNRGYPKPTIDAPALLQASNEYAYSSFAGEVNFVMVMLKPTGAYHFVQGSINGTSNQVELFDNIGAYAFFEPLQDKLWQTSVPAEAVRLIDQSLCKYFEQKARIGLHDFSPVIDFMLRNPAALTVSSIAKKFRCSERWIEKQCAAQTGLSPKTWLRLIRFRAASNYWLHHPQASWMEIVATFDYTDQSHFIRDFKIFSGSAPTTHFSLYADKETDFKQDKVGLITRIE